MRAPRRVRMTPEDTTMRATWLLALATIALTACEGAADVDTGDTTDDAPDIQGDYLVTLVDPEGCAGDHSAAAPFAGNLSVTGAAAALSFTFDDGIAISGSVDEAFFFEAAGEPALAQGAATFYVGGVATQDQETWVLEGEFTLELVDASPACVISGTLQARQTEG